MILTISADITASDDPTCSDEEKAALKEAEADVDAGLASIEADLEELEDQSLPSWRHPQCCLLCHAPHFVGCLKVCFLECLRYPCLPMELSHYLGKREYTASHLFPFYVLIHRLSCPLL